MKLIDLTHTIDNNMPVYPGTEGPSITPATTYEKDGYKETLLHMFSHVGTHMDAPAHLLDGHKTLDEFGPEQFVGSAIIIDCRHLKEGEKITMSEIFSKGEDVAKKAEYLVFMTGWDKRWGDESYFGDYPVVTDEVADFAIETGKKGLAFDVIGLDPISDLNLTLHKKVFAASDMVIIENLCDLDKVEEAAMGKEFTLIATPIKYKNADGAPIRALAMI